MQSCCHAFAHAQLSLIRRGVFPARKLADIIFRQNESSREGTSVRRTMHLTTLASCVRSETPTRVSELSQGAAVKLPAARNCILRKSAGASPTGRNGSSKTLRMPPHPINHTLTVSCNRRPCKGFLVPRGVVSWRVSGNA